MVKLDGKSDSQALEDASAAVLIEESIKNNESYLADGGALCSAESDPTTNKYIRFVVDESSCSDAIYWNEYNKACSSDFFNTLWEKVEDHIIHKNHYINHFEVGENADTYTPFECTTESAFHSLFLTQYYFTPEEKNIKKKAHWSVLHAVSYVPDDDDFEKSPYTIAICFAQRKIIIAGLHSTEAIKHTLYSIQSFLLIDKGILSLNAGLAETSQQYSLLFIGSSASKLNNLLHTSDLTINSDEYVFWQKKKLTRATKGFQIVSEDICSHPKFKKANNYFCHLLENQNYDPSSRQCLNNNQAKPLARWTFTNKQNADSDKQLDALFIVIHDAHGAYPPAAILDHSAAEQYFICGYNSERQPSDDQTTVRINETFSLAHQNYSELRKPFEYQQLFQKRLKHLECPIFLINSYCFIPHEDQEKAAQSFDSNFIDLLLSLRNQSADQARLNKYLKYYTPTNHPSRYFQPNTTDQDTLHALHQHLAQAIDQATGRFFDAND